MILLSLSWATQSLNDIVCYIFFCNGLPAVSGSRLQSLRCCNNILSIMLINMPASSLWHINQSLMPIVKLFCSWCQELCAELVITDFFSLAVVSDTSVATSYGCVQTESKWLYQRTFAPSGALGFKRGLPGNTWNIHLYLSCHLSMSLYILLCWSTECTALYFISLYFI